MYVVKRTGDIVDFSKDKIIQAVLKAMVEVGAHDVALASNIADYVESRNVESISVEKIQDIIEHKLLVSSYKEAAKAFILYRDRRDKIRKADTAIIDGVLKRINARNVENANANVDEYSFSGREKEAGSDVQKIIALDYMMDKEVAAAHRNGLIYQHDLDKYNVGAHNCLNVDIAKLLKDGFSTRNGDVRTASCFMTACQLVAVIFQCQSQI